MARNSWRHSAAALWFSCALPALLTLLLLAGGCAQRSEQSDGVQLILSTAQIEPGTTFELRFDQPIARSSQIGAEAQPSPLVFRPSVAGRFVYTSSRSGIFTPEQPLDLGAEYELTLQPGLEGLDHHPTKATLVCRIRTPAFGIVSGLSRPPSTNAYSNPEFRLWFNADVKAAEVAFHAGFSNPDGLRVPAVVRHGTEQDRDTYVAWDAGPVRTWKEQFEERQRISVRHRQRAGSTDSAPTNEIGNFLIVSPQQPLGVGRGWKLGLGPRLASADGRLYTEQVSEARIGDVLALTLEERSMHHVIHQAPRLQLRFSKPLNPDLVDSYTNWVQISPWPAELKAAVSGPTLSLSGGWQRDTNYAVVLRRGFPAEESFTLEAPSNFGVDVPAVDARLYFPAFSTEQFAGGRRAFPLLAVNVNRIRVRAKLLDSATAIHALRGYTSYFPHQSSYFSSEEGFKRLDFNLVPGRTVFSDELPGSQQEDRAEEIPLDWSRLLPGRQAGIVFLEAERPSSGFNPDKPLLGTQALVQLTDLGLVWKAASTQLWAFVFSYATGQPKSGVRLQLYSEENEPLREAITDNSGLATLITHTNATWLVAGIGDDLHAVELRQHNIPASSFGIPTRWDYAEDTDARRVLLFTDRDVYRPGDTVNLKAMARDLSAAGITIPAGLAGTVRCTDARGRQVFETNVVLGALGSCALPIPLPTSPRGGYELRLKLESRAYHHGITVADYQPAAFEIGLHPKPAYSPDEKINLPVTARYLFGKALNRARIHWSLEAEDQPFSPKGFERFTCARAPVERQWGRGSGSFALTGNTQINASTNCVISVDVPLNLAAPQPRAVSLLLEVTDLNQQTLTRSAEFLKHSSAFYLGVKQIEEVLQPGKPLPVEIVAVGANEAPWPQAVPAHLTLQRVEYRAVRVQGAGRAARYRTEATLTNLLEREILVSPAVQLPGAKREFSGASVDGILVPAGGEYLLEVKARDGAEREVVSSLSFYVADKGQMAWNYRNEVEAKLVADKPLYQPGDTALILVKAPFSGTAWISIESDKLLRSFVTRLEGNAPAFQVPIEGTDAPNIFVSMVLLRGATNNPHKTKEPEYRAGYCQLNVEDPRTRLRVQVASGATNYMPGQTVTAEAQILSATGEPVPEAEVTLYAVDEGVLGLTDYAVPDPHKVIFAERRLAVESGISLPFLLSEDPEQLTFQNKGYLGGGGGYEKLRQHFVACAFWNATARSGADGRVTARFTAPDSLTRYQLIAVVQTAASAFGSGRSAFSISKPLMVEPALPRFANITDHIQARAVVLNQTDRAGDVLVTLALDEKATAPDMAKLSQRVPVAAHGSATVEVPLVFVESGSANWTWRARFADNAQSSFSDAVRSTLEVGTLMPLLRDVALVRTGAGETNLLASINPQVLSGQGTISVTVANTSVVALGVKVAGLLHYPYGCAEQTGSSLLPWVLLQDTPELIPFTGREANDVGQAAAAGVQRLLSMQTPSGGLAYWPGGKEPMLWASAYGGLVLALARATSLPVPEQPFDALMVYLSGQLREQPEGASPVSDRCLALYALSVAGRAESAYVGVLFEQRARLSPEDRALLALASAVNQEDPQMANELLKTIPPTGRNAPDTFGCPAREKAIRLLALLACRPTDPEAAKLFAKLGQPQSHSEWTTQGNAWALLAMREFLRQTEAASEPSAGTLTWRGQTIPFQLPSEHGVFAQSFPMKSSAVDATLRLASSSAKPLFAQVTVESRSQATNQLREDHGLSLQRRYDRLNDQNEPERFDHLRVGDRVLITLRLTVAESANYVAVDDPLPSVLEALNSEFKTEQVAAGRSPAWMAQDEGDSWASDFRELRKDRVLFFANHLSSGSYVIRYVARVRAAGTVTAPPAKAEEMYHPDRFGLTETQSLTSQASD